MSMAYIRRSYGVPAKRGARVEYTGEAETQKGTITGTCGARLRIRMDGENYTGIYHPTWEIRYLPVAKDTTPPTHPAAAPGDKEE